MYGDAGKESSAPNTPGPRILTSEDQQTPGMIRKMAQESASVGRKEDEVYDQNESTEFANDEYRCIP